MFKNKMNAYGFMLIVAIWVVFTLLAFFGINHVAEVASYLVAIIAFLFFMIARKYNNGFAIIGLILGLSTALAASGGSLLPGGFGSGFATIGIAYLFFAFAFIKSESTTLNLLAWAQILTFVLVGIFGFWNVKVLVDIFGGIGNILVGLIFIYYLAGEAGINLPGNIDEKMKEKIG
jgi:hypothetical protein